jgi:Amt family ammonium transporter
MIPFASITIALFLTLASGPAHASAERFALQSNLDHVWTMIAAGLVFFMQAGFLLLESGFVRSKNSISVAQKNITDFVFSTLVFGAVGFMLMFGTSVGGLFGWDPNMLMLNTLNEWALTFFVFQLVFCGTAATIISGSTAERMKLEGYILVACATGLLIYPIAGHWAWGNLLNKENEPLLASWGFIDFAGSTVVHSVGAWIALASCIIIGPRLGRFDAAGKAVPINGHSAVLATAGCLILWVGWIGFNGGSTTAGTSEFALIVANTMVAGAAGGMSQMILGRIHQGLFRPEFTINGVLAGLVGITAGCAAVDVGGALAIGLSAAVVAFFGQILLERLRIDDAIGAIPVHGFAGFWGTVMVGVFARPEALSAGGRMEQILVQIAGAGLVFVWAFGTAFLIMYSADRLWRLFPGGGFRVRREDEVIGLNAAEHGATLGTGVLQKAMGELAFGRVRLSDRVAVEGGDEASELAALFNKVLERLQRIEQARRKRRLHGERTRRILDRIINKLSVDMKGVMNDELGSLAAHARTVSIEAETMRETGRNARKGSMDILSESDSSRQSVAATAEATEALSVAMDRIGREIDEALAKMREASLEARETRMAATQLQEASFAISELIDSITAISSQTHLLALNATIEAQRAGEAGRGFAVVASEVKTLATKTAKTTEHVTQHVNQVRSVIDAVTRRIETIAQRLSVVDVVSETTSSATHDVRVASRTIRDDMGRIRFGAEGIANSATLIGETSGEIARGSDALRVTASDVENAVTSLGAAFKGLLSDILEGEDLRAFPRLPYAVACVIEHDGKRHDARLVNISLDGFLIQNLPFDARSGDACILLLDGIRAPLSAEIRTVSEEGINCQFTSDACEDEDLNEIVDHLEGLDNQAGEWARAA